jgi:hypothetical protein
MRLLPPLVSGLVVLLAAKCLLPTDDRGVEAGTAERLSLEGLVERAGLILEGRVLSARGLEDPEGRIETEYVLEVARTFEGMDLPLRSVRLPGGVLPDGRGMLLAGMPRVAPGEELLLFLTQEGATGVRMPVGLAQGKLGMRRRSDGGRVLVREHAGVGLVDRATGALVEGEGIDVLDYAETVARIEAALVRKRGR